MKYFLVVLAFGIFVLASYNYSTNIKGKTKITIDNKRVYVQLADSPSERATGLMYIDKLPADSGMLFIFDTADYHSFWMKNTLIPLDILWLDQNANIIHIEEQVQPCYQDPCPVYQASAESLYVLEVNSGFVDKHNISTKSKVGFGL